MSILTSDEILAALATFIENQIKVASVNPNSVLFDSFVDRVQERVTELYSDLSTIQQEESINFAESITAAALDRLGFDWNVTRKGATFASGFVVFTSRTVPTATVRIGSADGTGGVTVQTRRRGDGTVISYTSTATEFLLPTTSLDPDTQTYRVSVPVQGTQTGPLGNADSGEITVLRTNIPGVDQVTNTVAITNGIAQETNTQLARRIASKVLGLHAGLENGLISVALSTDRVSDAAVSGPNDSDFMRDPDGGEVDLIILGDNSETVQESILKVVGVRDYTLSRRPVLSVESIQAVVGLTDGILSPTTDYTFIQDTTSATAFSEESADEVHFIFGAHIPNDNSNFTVTYRHDLLIEEVQTQVEADDSAFITAHPLVKRAKETLVDISVSVVKTTGSVSEVVKQQVQTQISTFIDSLGLGEPLQQSDLVLTIKELSSVDNITLPFTKLTRQGGSGTTDLTASKYEYFRTNPLGISVTVS